MKVAVFPEGGVHSAYLDVINLPPNGVEYVGDFTHAPESSINSKYIRVGKYILDKLCLPYFAIPKVDKDVDLIHSSQKLLFTDKDYVVDIEHGNPFMGADFVNKHEYRPYRSFVKRMLMSDNCKYILPWTNTAKEAFRYTHGFMGDKFFDEKVRTLYPATKYVGMHHKTDMFTFTFVGGSTWDTFYSKGGLQVLYAADLLSFFGYDIKLNFISKHIPDWFDIKGDGAFVANGLPRDKLMEMFMQTDVLLLPSVCDTFGMVLIEAMARGIPSIVADNFAAREVVGDTGLVIKRDSNVHEWFDDMGAKRFGKGRFHDQYRYGVYEPHYNHVKELVFAMVTLIEDSDALSILQSNCLNEVRDGRFSISNRNKQLKEIYE